jgi:hypothetical protein
MLNWLDLIIGLSFISQVCLDGRALSELQRLILPLRQGSYMVRPMQGLHFVGVLGAAYSR